MDILLATPINKTHYCVPPLGLGYLATGLRQANFGSVSILNPVKEKMNYERFSRFLMEQKPKILGIQCFSFDVKSVERMLEIAKESVPGMATVIGGPHPTAVTEEVFSSFRHLDFAIAGESEISLVMLARILFSGNGIFKNIPGLIYKDEGRVIVNSKDVIKDIDSMGMPAWDLISPATYPEEVQGAFYKTFPVAPIITSRGCPYECTFCANRIMMGRGVRYRDIRNVVEEIEHLAHNYGIKEFQILDDCFMARKNRVLDFCSKLKEKNLKISLAFPNGVRVDALDEEVLLALKEVGAYSITVGIESGSQRILDHMKKRLNLDTVRDKMKLVKKTGFDLSAFFIIGYPLETKEDIMKTIRFARSLPIDIAHYSSFLPLPGTEITDELLNSGKLKEINYSELFYSKTPFAPEGITKDELKDLQKKAFLSFYLRPRIIWRLFLKLKNLRHLKSILIRARDYIFLKRSTADG